MDEKIAWIGLALIHTPPAVAAVRPSLLTTLYGVGRESAVFPLLQHRAILFVSILTLCIWAVLDPAARRVACAAVAISMLGFIAVYLGHGAPSSLRTVFWTDVAGLPLLAWAAWRCATA